MSQDLQQTTSRFAELEKRLIEKHFQETEKDLSRLENQVQNLSLKLDYALENFMLRLTLRVGTIMFAAVAILTVFIIF